MASEDRRPRRTNDVLPSREQASPPFQLADNDHILVARLQVKIDPEHACVTRIHAVFNLQVVGQSNKPAVIGHLYGQTIDRAVMDSHQTEKTLFVSKMLAESSTSERLNRPMQHSSKREIDETEVIMQHIFYPDGTPREEFSHKFLDNTAKIHFIAEFQLSPKYRGCGLAKIAMHTYLRGIQRFEACHKFRGTVLLSPAALPQKENPYAARSPSRPIKTLVEIKHALIASYENAGFKVWSKGDDDLEGSAITIMGLKLTGPKIARVSTMPLTPASTAPAETAMNHLARTIDSAL